MKLKQIIKLKLNYNTATSREVPWELIYLMNPKDVKLPDSNTATQDDLCYQLFREYLLVEDSSSISTVLDYVDIEEIVTINPKREDTTSKVMTPRENVRKHLELRNYVMVIPLTVKKVKGLSAETFSERLKYFTSRNYREHRSNTSTHVSFPKVRLCLGRNFKAHPCATCSNFPTKVAVTESCTLGSRECLENIFTGGNNE